MLRYSGSAELSSKVPSWWVQWFTTAMKFYTNLIKKKKILFIFCVQREKISFSTLVISNWTLRALSLGRVSMLTVAEVRIAWQTTAGCHQPEIQNQTSRPERPTI